MYAVIEQGSKQYKVAEGDCLNIDLVDVKADAKKIELDKVLLVNDGKNVKVGTPFIKGAKVIASFKTTAEDAVVKDKKLFPMHFQEQTMLHLELVLGQVVVLKLPYLVGARALGEVMI